MAEQSYKYPEYKVEVVYLKDSKQIKEDTPETAGSKVEATKYFNRSLRLAASEDYGQDEVWVRMLHFNDIIKFKSVKVKQNNPAMKRYNIRTSSGATFVVEASSKEAAKQTVLEALKRGV